MYCGVFVLNAIHCIMHGLPIPHSFSQPNELPLTLLSPPINDALPRTIARQSPSLSPPHQVPEPDSTIALVPALRDKVRQVTAGVEQLASVPRDSLDSLRLQQARDDLRRYEAKSLGVKISLGSIWRLSALHAHVAPIMDSSFGHPSLPADEELTVADSMFNLFGGGVSSTTGSSGGIFGQSNLSSVGKGPQVELVYGSVVYDRGESLLVDPQKR
ncbi:hypothetical protein ACHAPA_010486 [Fusarium lateritium]